MNASLVQTLTELVAHLDYTPVETAEEGALVLAAIRDCRADLAVLHDEVTKDLCAVAGEKSFEVDGLGLVEIRQSRRRTQWRKDELIPAVIARIADEPGVVFDRETGERLPPHQLAHNVAVRLGECVSFGAGKVTGLRGIGLEPDEFCVEDEAAWSVKLPGRAL